MPSELPHDLRAAVVKFSNDETELLETYRAQFEATSTAGWGDPKMTDYNDYDAKRKSIERSPYDATIVQRIASMFRSWKFGLSLALGSFFALATLAFLRPFGVLNHEAPMTIGRQATAGVMLLLNLVMYSGLAICLVVVVRHLSAKLRRRSDNSESS